MNDIVAAKDEPVVLTVMDMNQIANVNDLTSHVMIISQAMRRVMREDLHFGLIPGCGDKPVLFQPGAHKLGVLFNLAPRYRVEPTDLSGGHREYEVTCELQHRGTGRFIGEGIGVASTRESKYLYRSENTKMPVPKEYWDSRDKELLGGPTFSPRKIDGRWYIFQQVEHGNPADYYNTVKKIAKKRAYMDAMLTATGASDIFQPDDDLAPEFHSGDSGSADEPRRSKPAPQARSGGDDNPIPEPAVGMLERSMKSNGVSPSAFCEHFGITEIGELKQGQVNEALSWIKNGPAND